MLEKHYFLLSDDFVFAQNLMQSVSSLELEKEVSFSVVDEEPSDISSVFRTYRNAIREILRMTALEKLSLLDGKKIEWDNPAEEKGDDSLGNFSCGGVIIVRDGQNQRSFRGPIEKWEAPQKVKSLLLRPFYTAYEWQDVCFWKIGLWNVLQSEKKDGFLAMPISNTFLFPDEIAQLEKGKPVFMRLAGLDMWLMEYLSAYTIAEEALYKVWAHLSD